MSNSLQDQLLKAGLVDEQRAKKVRSEKARRGKSKPKKGERQAREAAQKQQAELARREKAERDRDLNRQQQSKARRRAVMAQVRQIIEANRLSREGGEVAYNFVRNTKVKRIYVDEPMRAKLAAGKLAIVALDDVFEVVPVEATEKILARDPEWFVLINTPEPDDKPAEDDPYAGYEVPDDLMW